jgi:hypothetical protein
MYVYVSTGGAISFRYDYRFNGRRETLTLGRYGSAGLTLAQARERLIEVKKAIADGVSPAVEKQRAKRRLKEAHDFAQVAHPARHDRGQGERRRPARPLRRRRNL